jgi:hypothetical protein
MNLKDLIGQTVKIVEITGSEEGLLLVAKDGTQYEVYDHDFSCGGMTGLKARKMEQKMSLKSLRQIRGSLLVLTAIAMVVLGTAIGERYGHRTIGTGVSSLLGMILLFKAGEDFA